MDASDAVRNYLISLHSPEDLIDTAEVKKLETAVKKESDPLTRVLIRSELKEAQTPPVDQARENFLEHAKKWVSDTGADIDALIAEGVPADVLADAGLDVSADTTTTTRSKRQTSKKTTTSKSTKSTKASTKAADSTSTKKPRATRKKSSAAKKPSRGTGVSRDWIKANFPSGAFTIQQLIESSGASGRTVRMAVAEAVEEGNATEIGTDPNHTGRGRGATLYTAASTGKSVPPAPPASSDTEAAADKELVGAAS